MFRSTGKLLAKHAILLKLLFLSAFIALTNFGFVQRSGLLIERERWGALAVYLFIWALAIGATFVASLQPRWIWRLSWAVILAVSTTCAFGYYSISGSEMTVYDVVSLWNARHEAGRAAEFYGPQVMMLAGLVFTGFLLAIALPAPLKSARLRLWTGRLAFLPVLPIAAIAGIVGWTGGGGSQAMPKQFSPLAVSAVAAEKIITMKDHARGPVAWAPHAETQVKNILFLVDESIRADYLDFEAGNPYTPELAKLKADFVNFGPAASGGNCSHYSNFLLRSGARRSDLTDSVNSRPFIWSYAKKAGYRTVFIDAQASIMKNPGRLSNFMTVAETRDIDRYVSLSDVSTDVADFELLKIIKEEVAGNRPVFIYANKNGAHFPYDAAYPTDQAKFGPTVTESGSDGTRYSVASYRNAIAWSVDQFFSRFFAEVSLSNLAFVYTSDHGQALHPGVLTHCAIENPDPRQGLVPLLAYASDPALRARLEEGAGKSLGRASHFTIVPTLLEMMGYAGSDVASYYNESLFSQPASPPAFTSGDIFGMFSKEVLWHPIDLSKNYLEPEALELKPDVPLTASIAR